MKFTLHLAFLLATTNLTIVCAQTQELYSENFNNETLGTFGPLAQEGKAEYTPTNSVSDNTATEADFNIIKYSDTDNYASFNGMNTHPNNGVNRGLMYSKLKAKWDNRNTGNNLLRIHFQMFTGESKSNCFNTCALKATNGKTIGEIGFDDQNNQFHIGSHLKDGDKYEFLSINSNGQPATFPDKRWVNFIIRYNYDTGEVGFFAFFKDASGNDDSYGIVLDSSSEINFENLEPESLYFANFTYQGNSEASTFNFDAVKMTAENPSTLSNNNFENNENTITIYPNPVQDLVTISGNETKDISIYDLTGRLVYFSKNNEPVTTSSLNLKNLPSGTYQVSIKNSKGIRVIKTIIKN